VSLDYLINSHIGTIKEWLDIVALDIPDLDVVPVFGSITRTCERHYKVYMCFDKERMPSISEIGNNLLNHCAIEHKILASDTIILISFKTQGIYASPTWDSIFLPLSKDNLKFQATLNGYKDWWWLLPV